MESPPHCHLSPPLWPRHQEVRRHAARMALWQERAAAARTGPPAPCGYGGRSPAAGGRQWDYTGAEEHGKQGQLDNVGIDNADGGGEDATVTETMTRDMTYGALGDVYLYLMIMAVRLLFTAVMLIGLDRLLGASFCVFHTRVTPPNSLKPQGPSPHSQPVTGADLFILHLTPNLRIRRSPLLRNAKIVSTRTISAETL